jgi:cytosine/adenosine deaminase-related metal-dependent hydrolase
MDDQRREIEDGAIFVRGNVIEAVGPTGELPAAADIVIDAGDCVVMPGLVNTHHHLYQTLTRAVRPAQDAELFNWLKTLYPIWARMDAEAVYVSALVGLAELMLSGCTTTSDHLYIFPNGATLDDEIRAAQEIGVRFHATRGSMSLGESKGGLPPDSVVEAEDDILRDSRRLIEEYHDPARYAMLRVALAPCSPFSVTRDLMRESADLARSYGVRLHTHLAENDKDIDFSNEMFGMRPGEYAEDVGWVGDDVWHAHCVKLGPDEVRLFGQTRTGVAHCPGSNMRLGSGIAPIRAMRDAGVPVGLGVDGSASNDSGHMLGEARLAMLLQRVGGDPAGLTAREALEVATLGGAAALGRDDIGALAPGMAADFIAIKPDPVAWAGGWHDPVGSLIFCTPQHVHYSIINGQVAVKEGRLTTVDIAPVIERHNAVARAMVNGDV